MSWEDNLRTASYKGMEFEIVSGNDSSGRNLVENLFPYRDGSVHEDMGRKTVIFQMQAVFRGPDNDQKYRALFTLINDDKGEPGELIHPLLGSFTGYLSTVQGSYSADSRNFITCSLEFREDNGSINILEESKAKTFDSETAALDAAIADTQESLDDLKVAEPEVFDSEDAALAAAIKEQTGE